MLVNPKEYLAGARREGWALGGFNVFFRSHSSGLPSASRASSPRRTAGRAAISRSPQRNLPDREDSWRA